MAPIEDQRIAILGGTGAFGKHMAGLLEEENEIVISGSTLEKAIRAAEGRGWEAASSSKAVEQADIVIVSVPISVTEDVIHEVGPDVPDDALLCDVTSVKTGPCEAMEGYSSEVLGMHPMYGPSVSPEGQNVILCPVEGEGWRSFEQFWKLEGAEVHVTDPETHDRAVSVVQAMTHFTELAFASAVEETGLEEEELDKFATPHFSAIKDLAARTLDGDPALYDSIQQSSELNAEARQRMVEAAREVADSIEAGEMEELFESLDGFYDTGSARERTDRLIQFMEGS